MSTSLTLSDVVSSLARLNHLRHGGGATPAEIRLAETAIGTAFPDDLREFLREFGWMSSDEIELFGLGGDVPIHLDLVHMTLSERAEMYPPLPDNLLALSNDGAGNLFCLLGKGVVLWDHELGADQDPEPISPSFYRWVIERVRELTDLSH